MSKKNKVYVKKSFESTGQSDDTSANIYMSMLMSENFKKLSDRQVRLYLYCKAQYYADKRKPISKLTGISENHYFTMNRNKWLNLYQIYNNDNGQFNKDIKALIDLGFIELVESGQHTRTANIYKLSDKWHK